MIASFNVHNRQMPKQEWTIKGKLENSEDIQRVEDTGSTRFVYPPCIAIVRSFILISILQTPSVNEVPSPPSG